MDALGHDTCFLDLDSASEDRETAALVREEHPFRSVGAAYDADAGPTTHEESISLASAFDGLWFVSETTRANPLGDR